MEILDNTVAQAVYLTKVLEQAIHDEGPWTLSWGPFEVPVHRTLMADGVAFRAEFPEFCHIDPPHPVALLKCRGEVVSAKTIDFPGDGAFAVEWVMRTRVVENVG